MELTHSDWLHAVRTGDTAKWVLEEDPQGRAHYYRIEPGERNPYETGLAGPALVRNRKVRAQMGKKVAKHEKPYVYRLGYNHCIGQFSGQEDYPTLSGSSLNRLPQKKRPSKKATGPAIHYFSPRSRGKVKDKATAFYRSIPGDRIFLTLTFIQHVDDAQGTKILNKFLTVVRKERAGMEYLRVAEHQEENPNKTIHFHILMNRRLSVRRYNALWTLQQYNSGLRGRHADGREISIEEIRRRYVHDMTTPPRKKDPDGIQAVLNPADMRKAYGINSLANYLTAYVTKQKNKDPFGCLNWHCSRKVSKLFTREVVSPSTFAFLMSFANWKLDRKTGEGYPPQALKKQFFNMVYVNNKSAPLTRLKQMEQVNKWIMEDFDPGRSLPRLTGDVYRKLHMNEKVLTDGALPKQRAGPGRQKRHRTKADAGDATLF